MTGYFCGMKKTYILRFLFFLLLVFFVVMTTLSFTILSKPALFFYSFCLSIGLYQVAKGILFRLDSSFYLGSLLNFIGAFGFYFYLSNQTQFSAQYISSAFLFASMVTFLFFLQFFHLIVSYSIFFVNIFGWLLSKNLITLSIFIAFVVPFLVLLSVTIFLSIKWRK